MNIKEKTLQSVLHTLEVLGCRYMVIGPDGTQYGKPIEVKRAKKRVQNFAALKLLDRVKAMKVGDVDIIEVPANYTAGDIQRNVCSRAVQHLGAGAITTTVNGNTVEVLRLR